MAVCNNCIRLLRFYQFEFKATPHKDRIVNGKRLKIVFKKLHIYTQLPEFLTGFMKRIQSHRNFKGTLKGQRLIKHKERKIMSQQIYLSRKRTLDEAYNELKQLDPDTAYTKYYIRRLALSGAVPTVMCGRKRYTDSLRR